MNKTEFNELLKSIDIYNNDEYNKLVNILKHNICQNLRIARKLSNMSTECAAQLLNLEPQSLRRIEAERDRDDFSTKVFIMAIMIYKPDANFYFNNWKDNEVLLCKNDEKAIQLI